MIEDVINAFESNLEEVFDISQIKTEFCITFFHSSKEDHVQLFSKISYFLATLDMKYKVTIKHFGHISLPKHSSIFITFRLEER